MFQQLISQIHSAFHDIYNTPFGSPHLGEDIVVLDGGDVQQIGSPLDLYERPANKFVAQFIGSPTMNVVPVSPAKGGVTLVVGAFLALPHLADTGDAVELGIWAEHIDVVDFGESDLTAVADVVEHLGSDTNIYAQVKGLGPMMVRVHGNIAIKPGDPLGLGINGSNAHIFSADGTVVPLAPAIAA